MYDIKKEADKHFESSMEIINQFPPETHVMLHATVCSLLCATQARIITGDLKILKTKN